ncbi:MAG: type II toxin-antitoxin system VapC family toxin [Schwartzia sp.]|nr:type II toxin-antitoxin system VapC family toxin [Schwartzia sp. (in: firmicutes)]
MNLLLDTHILLWTLADDRKLSAKARALIGNKANVKYYSVVSLWETEIKHLLHPEKMPLGAKALAAYCERANMREIPVQHRHVFALGALKREENTALHKAPFDRIMLCQAMSEDMFFLTHDKMLSEYRQSFVLLV